MNIEAASTQSTTKSTQTTSSKSQTSCAANPEETKSFKDELEAKAQESQAAQAEVAAEEEGDKNAQIKLAAEVQKNATSTIAQNLDKSQLTTKNKTEEKDVTSPIDELSSELAAINSIKNNQFSEKLSGKTEDISKQTDYCKTIKMDNNDITFFLNLVDNQQMTAQNIQGTGTDINKTFNEIKTEATQKTLQVSTPLMDALNESLKTNKPIRIDFDSDVAVIMKVDKDGNLSANFIPGNAAVENYLRNNIAGLRQNFDEQGLPYKELSYSQQQQQKQQQEKRNNKEKENE